MTEQGNSSVRLEKAVDDELRKNSSLLLTHKIRQDTGTEMCVPCYQLHMEQLTTVADEVYCVTLDNWTCYVCDWFINYFTPDENPTKHLYLLTVRYRGPLYGVN